VACVGRVEARACAVLDCLCGVQLEARCSSPLSVGTVLNVTNPTYRGCLTPYFASNETCDEIASSLSIGVATSLGEPWAQLQRASRRPAGECLAGNLLAAQSRRAHGFGATLGLPERWVPQVPGAKTGSGLADKRSQPARALRVWYVVRPTSA